MSDKLRLQSAAIFAVVLLILAFPLRVFADNTFTPIDGISITANNSKSWGVGTESSMASDGTVTCKAIGGTSANTNNITLQNTSGYKAMISFDYTITNASSYTGFSATSGTYEVTLENEASVSFTITSGKYYDTVTLTMSNFSIQTILPEGTVTVSANLGLGYGYIQMDSTDISGYTYTGTDVTITDAGATFKAAANTKSITYNGTTVATSNDNAHFVAWVDPDTMEILSLSASYTIYPTTESMKIMAIFSKSYSVSAYFQVGNTLYEGLGNALAAYEAGVGSVITLRSTGSILKNESYTIPEGCTLLIPYDAAGTVFTTEPIYITSTTKAGAYKTLYMRANASLTIEGTLSVAGRHHYAKGNKETGCVNAGKFGAIRMLDGSSITVNGKLYCYGYIGGYSATSEGEVIVNDGATVYEYFQLEDFRGGTQTFTGMDNEVFPFSQYFVQNVQVPMTLHYGATEYAYVTLYLSGSGISKAVAFIGSSDSFVTLQEGATATKSYDITTDRMTIALNGNASLSSFALSMSIYSFDTADYIMPIPSNMTVKIESGSASVSQDLALIPGSKLEIGEGASLTLGNGTRLYVYDQDDWGTYCWDRASDTRNSKFQLLRYAYNRKYTRTEDDLIDAEILVNGTLDASAGALYTTAGKANINSTGSGVVKLTAGTDTVTYQFIQGYTESASDDTEEDTESVEHPSEYVSISIAPAMLKNSDETYVASGTDTYTYIDGFWRCGTHTFPEGAVKCSVCGIDLFTIDAAQVVAGNNLDMAFRFVYNGSATDLSAYTVKLSHAVADDKPIADATYTSDSWVVATDDNGTFYYVTYGGLAARRMCDTITLAVYSGDTQVSNTWTDSMQAYAIRKIEENEAILASATATDTQKNEAELLLTVLVDMLNYGAEAQKHFGYSIDKLANVNEYLTAERLAYATDAVSERTIPESTSNFLATNLVTTSNIQFLMAIEGLNGSSSATVSFANYKDTAKEISPATIGQTGDYYYVVVDDLVVADAWCQVTVTVNNVEYKDSIAGYLARYTGESAVYKAYLKFADSAYAYFTR